MAGPAPVPAPVPALSVLDVCPVRAEYSFAVTHADGRVERTEMGAGKTHLFYLDGFDEWTFKIE